MLTINDMEAQWDSTGLSSSYHYEENIKNLKQSPDCLGQSSLRAHEFLREGKRELQRAQQHLLPARKTPNIQQIV
jgi:hypothetical protein